MPPRDSMRCRPGASHLRRANPRERVGDVIPTYSAIPSTPPPFETVVIGENVERISGEGESRWTLRSGSPAKESPYLVTVFVVVVVESMWKLWNGEIQLMV